MNNQILSKCSILFILTFGKGRMQSCSLPLFEDNKGSERFFFTEIKYMPNPYRFLSFPLIFAKDCLILGGFLVRLTERKEAFGPME